MRPNPFLAVCLPANHDSFKALAAAVLVAACSAAAMGGDHVRYRVVPIAEAPGGYYVYASDLNNSNQMTGSANVNGAVRPILSADGHTQILDEIPGNYTGGTAVNDRGHVTGWMYEWGVIWPQAFLWDGASNHWLIDPNDSYTYGQGLNWRDQVVGMYYPPNGHPNGNAFVVTDGVYHDLGSGQATGISADGVIVGQNARSFGATSVWTPDGRGGWSQTLLDGTLATAINESATMFCGAGPLISYFNTAVVWNKVDGQWVRTDIGGWDPTQVDSLATDVNDRGQVVGYYQSFDIGHKGWVYENGEVYWLNDLLEPGSATWQVTNAQRINESGVILAQAMQGNGNFSVLLIPDELTVLAPRGAGAGSANELIALSAAPGSRVYFAAGLAQGSRGVPGCPGVSVGLAAPRLIGSATADSEGEARLPVFIPAAGAGRTVYLQAIDRSRCEVSNVLRYVLR